MFRSFVRSSMFLVLGAVHISCTPSETTSRPVAEASGPQTDASTEVPVDALKSLEKVYVPLNAASLFSLDEAREQKGYGNVMASDFKPVFETEDAEFGAAIIAFSSPDWVPPSSLFQPMSLTQWLDAALSYEDAQGVIVNPGHPGQTLSLTKEEITKAIEWLPRRDPLPMEIHMTR